VPACSAQQHAFLQHSCMGDTWLCVIGTTHPWTMLASNPVCAVSACLQQPLNLGLFLITHLVPLLLPVLFACIRLRAGGDG